MTLHESLASFAIDSGEVEATSLAFQSPGLLQRQRYLSPSQLGASLSYLMCASENAALGRILTVVVSLGISGGKGCEVGPNGVRCRLQPCGVCPVLPKDFRVKTAAPAHPGGLRVGIECNEIRHLQFDAREIPKFRIFGTVRFDWDGPKLLTELSDCV